MTIEEIKNLDNDAIEVRMAEIKNEMNLDDANLEMLNAELDAIEERRAIIKAEVEERAKEMAQVIESPVAEPIMVEERKSMSEVEMRNTREYINAYADYVKTGDDTECRALLTENVSGGSVPVPELVDGVVRHAWEKDGIMSRVRKSYVKGNLKVGFELSADGAVVHTEGANAPNVENLVTGIVTLVPASIKKWVKISDEVMDMSADAFLSYVYEEVAYQIAKKCADELIAKIEACGTASTSTQVSVPAVKVTTIGQDTIAKAIANLSDEADKPVVMMNKLTWADFKGKQYAGNYATDIFEGLDVVFNNSIKAFSVATTGETYAIVGDLGHGALANFPNGEEITFKFDDLSLAEADLVKIVGREFVGLGVVAPNSFVKITK